MNFEQQLEQSSLLDFIVYECPICGTKDRVTKKNFLRRKNKCLFCAERKKREEREKQIKERLLEKGFAIVGEVPPRTRDKVNYRCNKCGKTGESVLTNLLRERKKCDCHPDKKFQTNVTQEDFLEKVSPAIKDKFIFLSRYESRNTKMLIECKNCHTQSYRWGLTLLNTANIRCYCETRTKGEDLVFRVLQDIGIQNYIEQYQIQRDSSRFCFLDFYVPAYNLVIEYNGVQHYEPVPFFGGEEKFQQQTERDAFVKKYCLKNNLELLIFNDKDDYNSIKNTLIQFSKTFNDYPSAQYVEQQE